MTPQVLRLTNLAYTNSVRDLFPGVVMPAQTLPAASTAVVYDNDAIVQAPTATLIQAYQANANAIATAVTGSLAAVLPCAAATADDACALTYLTDLSSRAYRHRLRDDETARLTAAWQSVRVGNSTASGSTPRSHRASMPFRHAPSTIPSFTAIKLALETHSSNTSTDDAYIDDVALDVARIGCLP